MRIYRGWLFEDHFEYGHIQFEIQGAFWIKHYPTFFEAMEAAYRVGLITVAQTKLLREMDERRFIELQTDRPFAVAMLQRAGFVQIKQS